MVGIDPKNKKYIITFKPKDQRPNQRDDKLEILRNVTGLEDIRNILDMSRFAGPTHMHDKIMDVKTKYTVTDMNSYENPTLIVRLDRDQANRIRKDPNVLFVQEDYRGHWTADAVTWQWPEMHAGQAHASPLNTRGLGVNVAVLDSGVDKSHNDLAARVTVEQSFATDTDGFGLVSDSDHGTFIAGIIGASANGSGTMGIAPLCNIWNLRIGDESGFAGSDISEALQYCRQNKPHVMNMSFSGLLNNTGLENLFLTMRDTDGILMFAGMGNSGENMLEYPGANIAVNGVTSIGPGSAISGFSTRNNQVDFTAPGYQLSSCGFNNTIVTGSGTSFSSPCVAGVAALCVSAFTVGSCGPPYTPGASKVQIIEQVMRQSSVKQSSEGFLTGAAPRGTRDGLYGWGIPLADVCVAALKGILVSALPV